MIFKHAMVDLETLGTRNSSVFTSIAVTPFDIETGEMGTPFYKTVDIDSALRLGLTVDGHTLRWWMNNRANIRELMFEDPDPIGGVLGTLTAWWYDNDLAYPWGNSASFDLGILRNAYAAIGGNVPWRFWNERDYRTLNKLFPTGLEKPVDAHDPRVDNEFQIHNLCLIWKQIRNDYGKEETPEK